MANEKRLIDVNALPVTKAHIVDEAGFGADFYVVYEEDIRKAKTVDAVEVVHGRWEECDWVEYDGHEECIHYPHKGRVCTNCRNAFKKEFIDNPRINYCPHCGAKMDTVED